MSSDYIREPLTREEAGKLWRMPSPGNPGEGKPTAEVNQSGITPLDLTALVLPDKPSDKTAGGIIKPDSVLTREKHAALKCTFVAAGVSAFDGWKDAPKPGDRVIIEQYAGRFVEGPKDGREYRIVRNEDILAILEGE